jgi:hypothetical protein
MRTANSPDMGKVGQIHHKVHLPRKGGISMTVLSVALYGERLRIREQ